MCKKLAPLALVCLIAAAAGCGGGKGVETTVTATPPPDTDSRQIQPGDDMRWEVSGTHFDGWHSYPVTGTYSETVLSEQVTVPGVQPVQARVVSQEMALDTFKTEVLWDEDKGTWTAQKTGDEFKKLEEKINVTERYYVTQDADGSIWTYGGVSGTGMYGDTKRTGTEYWLTQPATGRYALVASPLSVGNGWSARVTQSDGTTFSPSFVVSASEVVTVPAGTFMAHRVEGNGRIAGMLGEIAMWWAPAIAAPCQFTVTSTDYIPNTFGAPPGGTGYSARTLTLTFKLAAKSRQAD